MASYEKTKKFGELIDSDTGERLTRFTGGPRKHSRWLVQRALNEHLQPAVRQAKKARRVKQGLDPVENSPDGRGMPTMMIDATIAVESIVNAIGDRNTERQTMNKSHPDFQRLHAGRPSKNTALGHQMAVSHKHLHKAGGDERLARERVRALQAIATEQLPASESVPDRWTSLATATEVRRLKQSIRATAEMTGLKSDQADEIVKSTGIMNFPMEVSNHFRIGLGDWVKQRSGVSTGEVPDELQVPRRVVDQVDYLIRLPDYQLDELAAAEDAVAKS
jgi:hypothetical protein